MKRETVHKSDKEIKELNTHTYASIHTYSHSKKYEKVDKSSWWNASEKRLKCHNLLKKAMQKGALKRKVKIKNTKAM